MDQRLQSIHHPYTHPPLVTLPPLVILSEAKDLSRCTEVLHCTQDDKAFLPTMQTVQNML